MNQDGGEYSCEAILDGEREYKRFHLNVIGKYCKFIFSHSLRMKKDKSIPTISQKELNLNDNVFLDCNCNNKFISLSYHVWTRQ